MINNKTITLSEQRNVAIANLNIAIKRCIEAEQGESPQSFELAEQVLEENQATVHSINEMLHRYADDFSHINKLESSFGDIKAKVHQREMRIIELQASIQNTQDELNQAKAEAHVYRQALTTEKHTNEALARRVAEQGKQLFELRAIFNKEVPADLMDVLQDLDAEGFDPAPDELCNCFADVIRNTDGGTKA